MKATPNLDFTVIEPTLKSLKAFVGMLKSIYQNLILVINGNLGFGDGTSPDNLSGSWINLVAPAAPNTDFTVNHNLNRLPVGYLTMQKDRACDVYTGGVASTKTQLTLRATVASAVLRLFVVGLLLSIFVPRSNAQGVRHVNIAQGTVTLAGSSGFSGAVSRPLAGASVTVCTGSTLPAAGTTCSGLASIFVDIGLTGLLNNPTNADTQGNYSFYAAGGVPYVVSVSAVGFTTNSYVWSAPLSSTGTITNATNLVGPGSISGTFSGNPTLTGGFTESGAATFTGALNGIATATTLTWLQSNL